MHPLKKLLGPEKSDNVHKTYSFSFSFVPTDANCICQFLLSYLMLKADGREKGE